MLTPRLRRVCKFNPNRSMVARFLPAAHVPIDSGGPQASRNEGIEKEVIDAQTRIASVRVTEVVPESVDAFVRMKHANRVYPTLREQPVIGRSCLWPEQRVVYPTFGFV